MTDYDYFKEELSRAKVEFLKTQPNDIEERKRLLNKCKQLEEKIRYEDMTKKRRKNNYENI